jgi:hypothetical protein
MASSVRVVDAAREIVPDTVAGHHEPRDVTAGQSVRD